MFQSTAASYNLLHIVNESVDIMYDKRLFSKEIIRNVNCNEEINWRDKLLISEKLCMFMSIHQCLKPNSLLVYCQRESKSKTTY